MNQTNVVAAIIKEKDKYLIVQRNKNKHLGLKWEFPGGKVKSVSYTHLTLPTKA